MSGALTFTNGVLDFGANNDFTLLSTASINTPGANRFVRSHGAAGTGQLKRVFTGNNSYIFPIGELTGTAQYSPVTINFTNNSTARTIGAKVTDAPHPSLNVGGTPGNYLTRYWSFTDDQPAAAGTYTIAMTYIAGGEDVAGSEASFKTAYWNGTSWTEATNNSVTSPVLTSSGVTEN
jgi:hypothetical protein